MSKLLKKLGKAKIDLENELWCVEGRNDKFYFNRRLIDTRADVKSIKSKYLKYVTADTPSVRKPNKREAHFQARADFKRELNECLIKAYDEMLKESFEFPIKLRGYKDFDHKSDWRYCIYKGEIYQFDQAGYTDDEMINRINQLETLQKKA